MKQVYYCKHSLLVYLCPCICLIVPFMLHITLQSEAYTIEKIARYLFVIFEMVGIYIFLVKSFCVVLNEGKLSLNFWKVPIKEISINDIVQIEKAKNIEIHWLALSKEQISITCRDNKQMNVSLVCNEKFIDAIKKQIHNPSRYRESELVDNDKLMSFVRLFMALLYLTVNGILIFDVAGKWVYYPIVIIAISLANVILLFKYIKSFCTN